MSILHSLYRYGLANNLGESPFTTTKIVKWEICIDEQGKFESLGALGEKGRAFEVPRVGLSMLSKKGPAYFLTESLENILTDVGGKPPSRRERFIKLHAQASENVPLLRPLVEFLNNNGEVEAALSEVKGRAKSSIKMEDTATFRIAGKNVLEEPDVLGWWIRERPNLWGWSEGEEGEVGVKDGICSITGEPAKVVRTASMMKGVAGGKPEMSFTSANNGAFEHYGFKQAFGSHISVEADARIREAWVSLTENNLNVVDGVGDIIHWIDNERILAVDVALDPFENDHDRVADLKDLVESIASGEGVRHRIHGANILVMRADNARFIVSKHIEQDAETLTANIIQWFDDLRIEGQRNQKFLNLLTSCLLSADRKDPQRTRKALKNEGKRVGLSMWSAAIENTMFDPAIIAKAQHLYSMWLLKNSKLSPILSYEQANRIALMKLDLIRKLRRKESTMTIEKSLDLKCSDPAYLVGRLVAIFENAQYAAVRTTNVIQATWMRIQDHPTILHEVHDKFLVAHAPKLKGLGVQFTKRVNEIMQMLPSSGLPRRFDLEDRSKFMIGYHHQRAHDAAQAEARKNQPPQTEA